jgi:Tol biopolymer transport system component
MRKLVVLAFLAVAVASAAATSAAAKPPGTNGLLSFTRFEPALQQDVVYTINPDASGEQQLLAGAESGQWSPDGSRILVVPDCCAERILNPDNGSYSELPTFYPDLGLFLGCGVWSPDGARLACEGFGDQPSADGVYTVRSSDGGDIRRVTSGADDDYPGDYSPNGKRIVFLRSSFDSGSIALYTLKLGGSDLRQLTPPGMNLDFTGGSWSPQGNEILFSGKRSEGQRSSIFVVHTDGSGLQQIPIPGCGTTAGCHEPVWSPDGRKIAFTMFVAQTGLTDLYTANPDGTGLYQVTHVGLGPDLLKDWGTHPLTH